MADNWYNFSDLTGRAPGSSAININKNNFYIFKYGGKFRYSIYQGVDVWKKNTAIGDAESVTTKYTDSSGTSHNVEKVASALYMIAKHRINISKGYVQYSSSATVYPIVLWYTIRTTQDHKTAVGSAGTMEVAAKGQLTYPNTAKVFNYFASHPTDSSYYAYVLKSDGLHQIKIDDIVTQIRKLFYQVHWEGSMSSFITLPKTSTFWYNVGWVDNRKIKEGIYWAIDSNGNGNIQSASANASNYYISCKRPANQPQYDKQANRKSDGTSSSDDDSGSNDDGSGSNDDNNTTTPLITTPIKKQPSGLPSPEIATSTDFITDFENFEGVFYACKDSRTTSLQAFSKTESTISDGSVITMDKIIDNDDDPANHHGQHLTLCVGNDAINSIDNAVKSSSIVDTSGIATITKNYDADEIELFSVLDQLQTGKGDYKVALNSLVSSSSNNIAEGYHFYQNDGTYDLNNESGQNNFAILGPFIQSTSLMYVNQEWIENRSCMMFAVIIKRDLYNNIAAGIEKDSNNVAYTWKRTIDTENNKILDGFAHILYDFSSLGKNKDAANFKPSILTWTEYRNLSTDEKKKYIIKYFDVIIDPNKALFLNDDGVSDVGVIANENIYMKKGTLAPYITVISKQTDGTLSESKVLTYDIIESTNNSFQAYLQANMNPIKTLFRRDFTVTLDLNDHKNTLKLMALKLFEAYTRGRDFIEEPYVEVRADEQKPKDETSVITLQRMANRWMSYDDNYFTYKYSGREFNLHYIDENGEHKYVLSQNIKDNNGDPIVVGQNYIQPIECAMVHSKDLLQESDVTLGNTYKCQKYYIQALKYIDADDGETYHYKDTFKITDYEKEVNTEYFKEKDGNKTTSYMDLYKKKNNKYILDDLDVVTSYIDLLKCPYYNVLMASSDNNWCDCCYQKNVSASTINNDKSKYVRECYYEKYGKCPYRFETEKHPRRIRTLKKDKSNRFNLIEELCKEFEFYPQFYIEYDEQTGKVKKYEKTDKEVKEGLRKTGQMKKHVYFMKERGQDKYAGFRYEKNLSSITRTVDSNQITTKLYVSDNDSDLMPKGVCSIQLAEDNIPKTSYILNFDYYIMRNLLNRKRVYQDLWGIDSKDRAFMSKLGKLNTVYDSYSDLITTLTSKEMIDLLAEIKVAVTGIGTGLEERQSVAQTMYQYKREYSSYSSKYGYYSSDTTDADSISSSSASTSTKTYWSKNHIFYNTAGESKTSTSTTKYKSVTETDTYKTYLTKYREQATIIWGLVEQLFFSGDYFSLPIKVDGIDNNIYSFVTYSYSNDNFNKAQDKRLKEKYLSESSDDYIWKYYYKLGASDEEKKGKLPYSDIKLLLGYHYNETTKAYTTDPDINYADIIASTKNKYCKGALFWRLIIEGFDFDNDIDVINRDMNYNVSDDSILQAQAYKRNINAHLPFSSWEDFKTTIVEKLLYPTTGQLGQYKGLYNQVKYWKIERSKILDQINEISEAFYKVYEPYIKEGTYSDSNFLDNNKYYWAGVDVLNDSCKPQVSYSINVIDISPIKEYAEDYTFEVGDITYIEDIDFFDINEVTGLPNRQKVLISDITYNLDQPSNNSITVQNYTSSFDDLFEQITATVQSLTYNENTYKRASNITSQQYISSASLQGALSQGGLTLLDSYNGNIVTTDDGTEGTGINNTSVKYKLDGQGLYFSNDGGETWDIGVGPTGINADYIKMGQLDASKIQIVDGNYIYFLWDKNGINAYRTPSKSTDGLKDFARFNKYGLSLIEKGNVRLRAGYDFKTKNYDTNYGPGYNESGDYTKEAELTDQNVGFFLYNSNGKSIFRTETASLYASQNNSNYYTARLSLDGEMFVTNTVLSNEAISSSVSTKVANCLRGAYNIVDIPIDILTKINGTDSTLSQKFTQTTQVQSRKSTAEYYLYNKKLYKYTNRENLSTDDNAQWCVHISSGSNIGYYYFSTSSAKINYKYMTNEYSIVDEDYTTTPITYYNMDDIEEKGTSSGVLPVTKNLYNVQASGIEEQSLYSYWEALTSDVLVGQNGRTDGGYSKTEQVGIFINNKIPSNLSQEPTDEEEMPTTNDDNENDMPEVTDNNSNSDDDDDDTITGSTFILGTDGSYDPITANDFIIVGDSLCQGLRANGGQYKDKFTGQGAMSLITTQLVGYDDSSKNGIVDLSNYTHIAFMFGTNGATTATATPNVTNDEYETCITRILNEKRGGKKDDVYIYIITPPCLEYINTDFVKNPTKEHVVSPDLSVSTIATAVGCKVGADNVIDIWEGSKNYGYDSSNTTNVHKGTTDGTYASKFAEYILTQVKNASTAGATNNDNTNNNNGTTIDSSSGLTPEELQERITAAQAGSQRLFTVAARVNDTEKGEYVSNVLTVLKSGYLYIGGQVKGKYGAPVDTNDLSYLPDEIKIENPGMVFSTDGVIWCNWDRFFRIIQDGDYSSFDSSGQSLMDYLRAAAASGGTTTTTTTTTGGVTGYFLIDPLSSSS